jgi:hypothetical protein
MQSGLAMSLIFAVSVGAAAQDGTVTTAPLTRVDERAQAQAVQDYWTPEVMAGAQPMPIPKRVLEVTAGSTVAAAPAPTGVPGVVNGWRPGSAPYVEKVRTFSQSEAQAMVLSPQSFGSAPTNPLSGPYGPFQRWTMEGNYLPWARGTHGKLFFSMGGGNFACSATVIGRSTIATAGHCVHQGAGGNFGSNWLFCPSYYNGGPGGAGIPHPSRGCWSGSSAQTSLPWITSSDPDYDYACIVLATTGTVVADKVGNVTGWSGRAWNWVDAPEMVFGYPQGPPFTGQIIQQVASVDWYDWDFVAGGQVSKIIGSDLTDGANGGGWFIGWRHPSVEFPDTDGNPVTDTGGTGGPYLNGVTSHQRCLVDCRNPPIATAGVFWQEGTSPSFQKDAPGEDWESEDVFAMCLADPNNNP